MSDAPVFSDFADRTDTILQVVAGEQPDREGKTMHFAFWIGAVGARHETIGVRGQVFRSNVDEHAAELRARGRVVKVLP